MEEASPGLDHLVELALAGEQIKIRKGSRVVELRAAQATQAAADEELTPCEALRLLQRTPEWPRSKRKDICENWMRSGWRLRAGVPHDSP